MNARRLAISIGLVAATSGAAMGQQRVNPVTINPGAGTPAIPTINVNPTTFVYGTPYGYGGYPGYYGGVAIVSPGGGFYSNGFGGYGGDLYNNGFGGYGGGFGGYGFGVNSSNDDWAVRQQQAALAASRYEVNNAQATEAYARANLLQQQAIATAIQNTQAAPPPPIQVRYNTRTTRPRGAARAPKPEPLPALDKLVTKEGKVLWADSAPKDESRDKFDKAIATLAREFQEAGKADVDDVNAARDALYAYGTPALAKVRRERPGEAAALKSFLNGLDAALVGWAK